MSNKLEDKHSWDELGVLFADRIEKHGFIATKDWKREKFLTWFKLREKLGIRFDWRLVARAYMIWKSLHEEHDHFTVIVGGEGSGKTTLAVQFSAWVSPNLDLTDLVFDMPNYIDKLKGISKNFKYKGLNKEDKSILIDEGGISLFSREALSQSNKVLAKTFFVQRFLNVHVGICIPHYWSLDSLVRDHRINTLIVITKRGYYKTIVGQGIKILNKNGSKKKDVPIKAISIPYQFFWEGNFAVEFPKTIDKDKYNVHKLKHITNFLDDVSLEAQGFKMVKVAKLEKEFGIDARTIISQIHDGEIEGRKIGKQWFITKKAYEKLVMKPVS